MGGIIGNINNDTEPVEALDVSVVEQDEVQHAIESQVSTDAFRDLFRQFKGMVSALIPVLGILGIKFDWLNETNVNITALAVAAVFSFGITAKAIYRNHYASKSAQKQNKALKERGLR